MASKNSEDVEVIWLMSRTICSYGTYYACKLVDGVYGHMWEDECKKYGLPYGSRDRLRDIHRLKEPKADWLHKLWRKIKFWAGKK